MALHLTSCIARCAITYNPCVREGGPSARHCLAQRNKVMGLQFDPIATVSNALKIYLCAPVHVMRHFRLDDRLRFDQSFHLGCNWCILV